MRAFVLFHLEGAMKSLAPLHSLQSQTEIAVCRYSACSCSSHENTCVQRMKFSCRSSSPCWLRVVGPGSDWGVSSSSLCVLWVWVSLCSTPPSAEGLGVLKFPLVSPSGVWCGFMRITWVSTARPTQFCNCSQGNPIPSVVGAFGDGSPL